VRSGTTIASHSLFGVPERDREPRGLVAGGFVLLRGCLMSKARADTPVATLTVRWRLGGLQFGRKLTTELPLFFEGLLTRRRGSQKPCSALRPRYCAGEEQLLEATGSQSWVGV
jgi:hypothetical protein